MGNRASYSWLLKILLGAFYNCVGAMTVKCWAFHLKRSHTRFGKNVSATEAKFIVELHKRFGSACSPALGPKYCAALAYGT